MNTKMITLAQRFLEGVGLADVSLEKAREIALIPGADPTNLMAAGVGTLKYCVTKRVSDPAEALEFVSLLSWPATRHVLFDAGRNLTGFINNCRNGSDYADFQYTFARQLKCRFARVVDIKPELGLAALEKDRLKYEARIFDVVNSRGESTRMVYCANDDGKWKFGSEGTPAPGEPELPIKAPKKSDRFTREHLKLIARAHGLPIPDAEGFLTSKEFLLVTQDRGPNVQTCTIEEADDPAYWHYIGALGYVAHMTTHASSVLSLCERCVACNSAYEPKVREYILAARRQLQADAAPKVNP